MWIFTILPEWAFHILLTVAILAVTAGFVLGMVPVIKKYAIPMKVLGAFALFLAVYLEGGLSDYREWELKAKELELKLADMENQKKQVDVQIVEKVITKKQVIREKGKDVVKYVDREIIKYDEKFSPGGECAIPQEFFKAYNDSLGIEQK